MESDNTVFLLVGPRGSGKTSYIGRLLESQSELSAVNRDEIFVRLFSSTHGSAYGGEINAVKLITGRLLRFKLSTQRNSKIVLEYWTGESRDRQNLTTELRKYGASKVVALYFVTPGELVSEWFWKKPGVAKVSDIKNQHPEGTVFFSESTPSRDHEVFHQFAAGIDSDGFDEVIRINPLGPLIAL
jgi:hypothetical protein